VETGEAQRASRGEADDIMCQNKIFRQQIQVHRVFFFKKKKKSRQMLDSIQRDKKWALKRIYRILLGFILLFHALKNMAVFIYSTHKSIYIVIVTTFFLFFIVMTT
jgi:hypothetical protein